MQSFQTWCRWHSVIRKRISSFILLVNDRAAVTTAARDIIDNANANTRSILDFLVQDRITALTTENQALKGQISQSEQNAYLINALRPAAGPAYLVANPYTGMYGTYGYNALYGGVLSNGFVS